MQADNDIDTIAELMADNDQLLDKIGNLIDQKLEPINKRLDAQGSSIAQIKTAVETVKAGQDDLSEKVANLPTRPEFQDFQAGVGRKLRDYGNRIEELEQDANIPHPHKH